MLRTSRNEFERGGSSVVLHGSNRRSWSAAHRREANPYCRGWRFAVLAPALKHRRNSTGETTVQDLHNLKPLTGLLRECP